MSNMDYMINISYIIYVLIFMYMKGLLMIIYNFLNNICYYSFMIYIKIYYNIMIIICDKIIDIYIYLYDKLFITIEENDNNDKIDNYGILLSKIEKLKTEVNEIRSKRNNDNICSICYENKINICCNPCGHLYCNKCIQDSNNCYICRKNIITTIKIYI